ncbi:MAG TPA: dTMP kinase [Candidatus Binatia bacterium]|nr:dTMP kinase [Candidatus Binatia bacterium]
MAGVFITIEGPEGSGKTVVAKRLATELAARGRRVRLTREPGGTRLGERVRELLLGKADLGISPRADALLFNAARAQLVAEVIRPALEAGELVICARFADSTLAYQGYGGGLPLVELRALANVATGGLEPDRTILLDVDPETGIRRKAEGARNRFEGFDIAFHRRVRDGFLDLAREEPGRWRVVDSTQHIDAVFDDALRLVLEIAG